MEESEIREIRHKFFFETPLYESVSYEDIEADTLLSGDVDAYNPVKKVDTTYTIHSSRVDSYGWSGYCKVELTCKRFQDALRFYVIRFTDGSVMKVGQFPSLADIQYANIGKRYDKLLNDEELGNYKRAIGLAAHGIGAGSLVYLRRIFEDLISQTYRDNQAKLSVQSKIFLTSRMEDKVETLKAFLPSQLVKMKRVYSILSKGVHELSEEECLKYFPTLKLSIELILDEKISQALIAAREKKVNEEIQRISGEMSQPKK